MDIQIYTDHLIPLEPGQAVSHGWTSATGFKPMGVTWHWSVTRNLPTLDRVLGGAHASRKGIASAHYGNGRSFEEGVSRYVILDNRSWHAGKNQTLRWDGQPSTQQTKGSRATIGIETVHIGYASPTIPADPTWVTVPGTLTRDSYQVQDWPPDQFEMMVAVGREIIQRWPHIGPDDHHGHHDLCPGYKLNVIGFDFARLIRAIHDAPDYPDYWSPFNSVRGRQAALMALGYDLGTSGADKVWGRLSQGAFELYQSDADEVANGHWTSWTSKDVYQRLIERGLDPSHL